MTVNEVAISAAQILQADDILTALTNGSADADADMLVKCVNMAAAELDGDFPVIIEKTVVSAGGIIPLSELVGAVAVVRVEHCKTPVCFTFGPRGISVPFDGEFCVCYTPARSDAERDGEILLGAGADMYLASYLTARNYCLVTGRTDEAAIWDARYSEEAAKKRLARRITMPRRKWL